MNQEQLTNRQAAIIAFLKAQVAERGICPSVREIGAQFGIRSPNGVMCHLKALEKKGFIQRDPRKARSLVLSEFLPQRAVIRLAGVVRAGQPVFAEELEETLDYSDLFGFEMFALRVDGESMIDESIRPGDVVIVRKADVAKSGAIVVAMADGEQTLKRFERRAGRNWLCPANASMLPFCPKELEILGVVEGVIRRVA